MRDKNVDFIFVKSSRNSSSSKLHVRWKRKKISTLQFVRGYVESKILRKNDELQTSKPVWNVVYCEASMLFLENDETCFFETNILCSRWVLDVQRCIKMWRSTESYLSNTHSNLRGVSFFTTIFFKFGYDVCMYLICKPWNYWWYNDWFLRNSPSKFEFWPSFDKILSSLLLRNRTRWICLTLTYVLEVYL